MVVSVDVIIVVVVNVFVVVAELKLITEWMFMKQQQRGTWILVLRRLKQLQVDQNL